MIDEINRGNVSKIFGETILALDREYTVQLPTALIAKDGTTVTEFRIPENVYILATMNSADRSIALVDYAIRRRFAFVNFYPNSEVVDFESDYSQLDDIKVGKIMDGIDVYKRQIQNAQRIEQYHIQNGSNKPFGIAVNPFTDIYQLIESLL